MSDIPLYEFSKSKNNTELIEKIRLHILGRKNKTAPNSKETIGTLSNSNFRVNKNTNIGKIKGKVEIMNFKRKTYYFLVNQIEYFNTYAFEKVKVIKKKFIIMNGQI